VAEAREGGTVSDDILDEFDDGAVPYDVGRQVKRRRGIHLTPTELATLVPEAVRLKADGFGLDEIAERLNVSNPTVRNLLSRAKW
jgi:DNA-binding CsgD family transcriptional regulator